MLQRQCSAYKKDGTRCSRMCWSSTCRQHRFSKNLPRPGTIPIGPTELTLTLVVNIHLGYFTELPSVIDSLIRERILQNYCQIDSYVAQRGLGGRHGPETLIVKIVNAYLVDDKIQQKIDKPDKSDKLDKSDKGKFYDSDNPDSDDTSESSSSRSSSSGQITGPKIEGIVKVTVTKDPKTNPSIFFSESDFEGLLYNFNIARSENIEEFIIMDGDWQDIKHRDYFSKNLLEEIEDEDKFLPAGQSPDDSSFLCIDYSTNLSKINGYKIKMDENHRYRSRASSEKIRLMLQNIFNNVLNDVKNSAAVRNQDIKDGE